MNTLVRAKYTRHRQQFAQAAYPVRVPGVYLCELSDKASQNHHGIPRGQHGRCAGGPLTQRLTETLGQQFIVDKRCAHQAHSG